MNGLLASNICLPQRISPAVVFAKLSGGGKDNSVLLWDLDVFLLTVQLLQIVLLFHRLKTLPTAVLDSKIGVSEGRFGYKYPFRQHFTSPQSVWILYISMI